MKKLSTYLFLVLFSFSAPSFADDVRDFQIEGMSVGDSLLDYFSENEIKKMISDKLEYPNDKSFFGIDSEKSSYETYELVQFHIKKNDNKYIIYSITGDIFYKNNIEDCYKTKDEIVLELSGMLKNNAKMVDSGTKKHAADSESTTTNVWFDFDSGDTILVSCYDWSEKMRKYDTLKVAVDRKEFLDWLANKAY